MSDSESKVLAPEAIEMLADYDLNVKAGRGAITSNWRALWLETKSILTGSGHYTESGTRLEVDSDARSEYSGAIESLEHNLGVVVRCAQANLPLKPKKGESLPRETSIEEVLAACGEILYARDWREPEFYRIALFAVAKSSLADSLIWLPIDEQPDWLNVVKGVGSLLLLAVYGLLFLAAPMFAAHAMVSAGDGDIAGAAIAMYALGLTYVFSKFKRRLGQDAPKTQAEKTHRAWAGIVYGLPRKGGWQSTGVGAAAHLRKIQDGGVDVPPVAFDLCAALEAATIGRRFPADQRP